MVKRWFSSWASFSAPFVAFALGQSTQKPLSTGPVFSGEDFGFQADEPLALRCRRGAVRSQEDSS